MGFYGLAGPDSVLDSFRAANRSARDLLAQGNRSGAYQQLATARSLFGAGSAAWQAGVSDELAYTEALFAGDAGARADYSAGQVLLTTATANAKPASTWDVVQDASEGFAAGLEEGAGNVAKGNWFFGRNPANDLGGAVGGSAGGFLGGVLDGLRPLAWPIGLGAAAFVGYQLLKR